MAFKKSGNKNLKIAAATAMAIFSLFSVFSATYAWFVAKRKVKNTNDNFDVNPTSGMFYKMTIHDCVNIGNNLYQFDSDPEETITVVDWKTKQVNKTFKNGNSFAMGTYDYLEKSHPILMLIQLGDNDMTTGYAATEDKPISAKAKSKTSYFVGDMQPGRTIYSEEDIDPNAGHINPLSSVVSYKSTYFASDSALSSILVDNGYSHGGHDYDTYNFTISSLTNTSGSFTEFNNDDTYRTYNSDRTVFTTSSFDYSSVDSSDVRYIAVVFDYYEAAVEAIYSAFIGDSVLDDVLIFNCDWTMEI